MAKPKHITAADLRKLHKPGCLTRHQKRANGNPCSHQWQAGEKARAHPKLYEVADHPKWSPKIASNFEYFRDPYWHNAHHIIPSGSLKNAIAAQKGAPGLVNMIKQGLLEAKYNLNDQVNMVILPMQAYHSRALGLPKHLKGKARSHRNYSDDAEERLRPIMDEYAIKAKDAIDKAKRKHQSPNATLSKKQLEELSESIFTMICIVARDPDTRGKSLAELSDIIFSFG
jgi:hypothetical protein